MTVLSVFTIFITSVMDLNETHMTNPLWPPHARFRWAVQYFSTLTVARELTEKDALAAHIRDELGITETSQANPMQAALASGAAFSCGGILPLLVTLFAPVESMEYWLYGFTILFLIILGVISAKTGGSSVPKAIIRITIWGTVAMILSALMGYLFGVNVS